MLEKNTVVQTAKVGLCQTNLFEINCNADQRCHGKCVWNECLFITSTDTPRHKQVDKKYKQYIVVLKRHTQLRKLDPQNAW